MDAEIRKRLMAMPGEYGAEGANLQHTQGILSKLRRDQETVKANIRDETAKRFPEKSNKEVRDAMTAEALASDSGLQVLAVEIQTWEEKVKGFTFNLEALRFEFHCLETIANNDMRDEQVTVHVKPGELDPRD